MRINRLRNKLKAWHEVRDRFKKTIMEREKLEKEKAQIEADKEWVNGEIKKLAEKDNFAAMMTLMRMYQDEWIYRDTSFWKHVFTFFYASLFVTLLPSIIVIKAGKDSFSNVGIPPWLFPIVGILIAVVFIFLAVQDGERSNAARLSYQKVMKQLPDKWQREPVPDMAQIRVGVRMCWCMFAGLLLLALVALALFI